GCTVWLGDNLYPHIPVGGSMASCDDPATKSPFVASVFVVDYLVLCFLCLRIPFP
ncbi:hypothetical protein A2U01_0065038, partial [Trifolium medium]|nr:hypothetical protein [Trifolium medium]